MFRVALPPTSVAAQALSRAEIDQRIVDAVQCLLKLLPALEAGIVEIIFDARAQTRVLGLGEPLIASVSRMSDREAARLWLIFTRNRSRLSRGNLETSTVRSAEGIVSDDLSP